MAVPMQAWDSEKMKLALPSSMRLHCTLAFSKWEARTLRSWKSILGYRIHGTTPTGNPNHGNQNCR